MKIKITGDRGKQFDISIIVEVIDKHEYGYTVRHTDGKIAGIGLTGGTYHRMVGSKFVTLMKDCIVEKA